MIRKPLSRLKGFQSRTEDSSGEPYPTARLALFRSFRSEKNSRSKHGGLAKQPHPHENAPELLMVFCKVGTRWENVDIGCLFAAKVFSGFEGTFKLVSKRSERRNKTANGA